MTKEQRQHIVQRQQARLESRIIDLRQRSDRYTWTRLGIIGGGLLLSGLVGYTVSLLAMLFVWLLIVISFGVAVYFHRRIDQTLRHFEAAAELKRSQLARLTLDWANLPHFSQRQPSYDHPFEADLDIDGARSLLHLIDNTVSHESTHRLRSWLTQPEPNWEASQTRQQRVRALIPLSAFRDKLIIRAVVAAGSRKMWSGRGFLDWLGQPADTTARLLWLLFGAGFVTLNVGLFIAERVGVLPGIWQITGIVYFFILLGRVQPHNQLFMQAVRLQETLQQLRAVFHHLERFSHPRTPPLAELTRPFREADHRPTQALSRLTGLVFGIAWRNNPLTWLLLNAVFPYDFWFAYRLSRQKQRLAPLAETWLSTWFEVEALSALANLAYLNPHYTLPTVLPATDSGNVLQATQLGHPLIPDAAKVCNDFTIAQRGQVALITGSNMAGKSTFLRTIGLNLALAYAGGPVNASQMDVQVLRLFSCIKVSDSVTSGVSYFYAEVKRLKRLLTELETEQSLPLLFLIDEIFRGTNNRERFIGSRAYIRRLVGRNGVGFVSTHDLALTQLSEDASQIRNYHFRDDVVDEQMVFSYQLHDGPCPTTNALKLMALAGLPVDGDG